MSIAFTYGIVGISTIRFSHRPIDNGKEMLVREEASKMVNGFKAESYIWDGDNDGLDREKMPDF